ncbi:MAG: long-chain fatty acid--CoA ligase [Polyangiaceae bacterium]
MAEPFKNLVDMFEQSVKKYGSSPLFGTKKNGVWHWTSFTEVGKMVDEVRGGLAALGVKRGDNVAVVANNRLEWAVLAYACYGLGAALVPMYEAVKPSEWQYIVNDCGAVMLVAGTPKAYEGCKKLKEAVPTVQNIIGMDLPDSDPESFGALRAKGRESPVKSIDPEPKDTSCLIYTSGTTGNPKGVILSHGNIISNVNAVQEMLPIGTDDRSLSFLPWAHSFGHTCELHSMLSRGASIALAEAVDKIIDNLSEVHPTLLFSVPRIFNRVYDNVNKQIASRPAFVQKMVAAALSCANKRRRGETPTFFESLSYPIAKKVVFSKVVARLGGRLKYAFSGGAALSREVAEFIDNIGITVFEGYGLTETSPIATANRPGAHRIGSVGKAIKDVKITIDKSQTSPDSKDGEIVISGPNVMQGYYKLETETKAVFTDDGGFRSGDLGYVDGEGFLYITGRLKELYKLANGKYVAPAPLEEKLKLSPFIANCMVYGDNRAFNIVVVAPDLPNLKVWAEQHGITTSSPEALIQDARVVEHMKSEVDKYAKEFKGFEDIKKVVIVPEDFTVENGLLTPSLKLKRRVAVQRYGAQIDAQYTEG